MTQPVTLCYWDLRGQSEKCRQLLQYCGVSYIQEIYKNPEDKGRWFEKDKVKLIPKNPAVTMPYLLDGDKVISESDAICIYICHKSKKVELLGRNADEWVLSATVHGVFKDFHRNYMKLCYGTYENEAAFQVAVKESLVEFGTYFKKFDGLLGDKQFIAGGIMWVDFLVADLLQTVGMITDEYLKPFPRLAAYQKRVWGQPELKAYFASDRFKERPCNGVSAHWR